MYITTKKVIFVGSKSLGYTVLKTMYRLAPEQLDACITMGDGKDHRSCRKEIKEFCLENQIPCFEVAGNCDISGIIADRKPDICFVVGWYRMIPERVIRLVPQGFLGIHNSLLPAYRGQAPLVWAMMQGEKEIGFSLFSFSDRMDEGKIWAQEKVQIDEDTYIADVLQEFDKLAESLFEKVYLRILLGEVQPLPQSGVVSYGGKRCPASGRIDWKEDALKIVRGIHAQSDPYPGAYTIWNGKKLTIWKARRFQYDFFGVPGHVGLILDGDIVVACGGNTAIILEEVEYDGFRGVARKLIKSLDFAFS